MDKLLILLACISIGQFSSGFTITPTNTADVAGSSNITLECASTYGTNNTNWYFTSLGSSSNQITWLSNGSSVFEPYQQQYVLRATTFSSVLVVRQLSSLTEGNYTCIDLGGSASALLLVIPSPVVVEPLFGPIAGGTKITIAVGSATIQYLFNSTYSNAHIPYTTDVRYVYIGKDLLSTNVSLPPIDSSSSTVQLGAVTPSTTVSSIGQPMPIIIGFSPTPFNISINRVFTYMPNPEITSIYPNQFIATGGIILDVTGQGLSSVTKPLIQLTVVITRGLEGRTTSNTSTEDCAVQPGNGTHMLCPMPPLNLPDDFLESLYSRNNTGALRRKRFTRPRNRFAAKSQSLLSRVKRDTNVLTVYGSNSTDRADIYLGFILDGQKNYENINNVLPNTKIYFNPAPEIDSSKQLIEFDPNSNELIYVKGKRMSIGCRLIDYVVHIGNGICNNSDLHDNQLSCRPPKAKPSLTPNDTLYCDQHLSIRIDLGYKHFQYACIRYTGQSSTGLTVELAGFVIPLAIIIVCIVRHW